MLNKVYTNFNVFFVILIIFLIVHLTHCSSLWRNNFETLSNNTNSSSQNDESLNSFKCKTDASCIDSHSICLNGSCRKICNNNHDNNDKDCLYFHCDGKLSNLIESKKLRQITDDNKSTKILIETNNYPLLKRYLSNKKCSWILKNLNHEALTSNDTLPFIQLKFERFSTELTNDYLYIFAGDSIFSPLIAALSGNEMASNEPSATADYEYNDESDTSIKSLNLTFLNLTSIYLLFKSDVTSQFQSQTSRSFNNFLPNGISIKYRFSSPCINGSNENNDQIFCVHSNTKLKTRDSIPIKKQRQIETVNYIDNENQNWLKSLNSTLRRAFHCSFVYRNYFYAIGGYSFISNSISFISRLNLNDLKWEHHIDKPNKQSNRSNRRLYSDYNYKPRQQKQAEQFQFPQDRYAHSCVLDENNNQFYMYGGVKFENDYYQTNSSTNKQITNELWKFNLISNKWLLLNSDSNNEHIDNKKLYILPIGVAGHSMSLIKKNTSLNKNSSILIFFGFSEYYGSTLNIIQEYNLASKTWRLHNTLAFDVNIGFAHSAVPDPINDVIYLYGGLNINSPVSNNFSSTSTSSFLFDSLIKSKIPSHISSKLYAYDFKKSEWKQLSSSRLASYLHSSILYKNYILTYGGILFDIEKLKNQDDSSLIISNQLRFFDLNSNEWFENVFFRDTNINMKFKHRQRYSHTCFVYNHSLYIFAGFNGFFLNDLFKFDIKSIITDNFEMNNNKKRQLIYPTNGDDPILLQQPLFQEFPNLDNPKLNFIDISRSSKQKQQSILSSIETCNMYMSCHTCQSDLNCIWNLKRCEFYSASSLSSHLNDSSNTVRVLYKKPSCGNICNEFKSCHNCTSSQNECVWCATQSKCILNKAMQVYFPFGECINYISERNQCEARINSNLPQLFAYSNPNSAAYVNSCLNQYSNCSACIRDEKCGWCSKDVNYNENEFNLNLKNRTLNTGIGVCMEGGEDNSFGNKCKLNWFFSLCPACECNGHSVCNDGDTNKLPVLGNKVLVDYNSNTLVYKQYLSNSCGKCLNNTDGENCSQCKKGYYGNSKNNGTCYPCDCGKQTSICDVNNGRCFCNTKGVIGSKCDQCETPRYTGRPYLPDGSCYYNLSTDYQFTFNLNKESDRYYTRINFVNHPSRGSDDDIDFMVRCYRENALINVSFVMPLSDYGDYDYESEDQFSSDYFPSTKPTILSNDGEWQNELLLSNLSNLFSSFAHNQSRLRKEKQGINHNYNNGMNNYYFGSHSNIIPILVGINCTSSEFKYTFNNREFNYADKNRNSTFIVHVYNFQTPITIQIAFSRRSRIQLLHFFITFFGCLFSLLAIAFISWKSKQRYDRYRHQRQIIIQMEQMASRPFTRLLVDVTKQDCLEANNFNVVKGEIKNEKSFRSKKSFLSRKNSIKKSIEDDSVANKINESNNDVAVVSTAKSVAIMPVAVEPLSNNKTAILTCLLKLPQGGLNLTPKGSSPLVLASAYVQINSYSQLVKSQNNSNPDSIMIDEEQESSERTENV